MKQVKNNNEERKQEKSLNPLKITAIVLSSLAAVLVLAAVGLGFYLWNSSSSGSNLFDSRDNAVIQPTDPAALELMIDADWIDENGNAYNYRDDVISILLMGIDYMGEEENWEEGMLSNGGNADMLGLVILDTTTFDFSILYIPRDTMADVIAMDAEGNYLDTVYTNISEAHSYGDGDALSCQLTADAVSRLLLGAPVMRYAALNCNAIYTLNEIVGGVRITFDSDCTDLHASFTEGNTVTLSNLYLSMLMTYRDYDNLDGAYIRGMRILNVMKAMFDQLKGKIMEDPAVVLDILSKLSDYLMTDLDLSEITFLARNIDKMDFSMDSIVSLPGENVMGEQYVEFHADQEWIYDFVVDKFCEPAA